MLLTTRPFAAAGAAALLAASLTACGGGTPTDASADDFCEAAEGSLNELGVSFEDTDGVEKAWADAADKMEEVGTPSDIPDEAREGFETTIDLLRDLDPEELSQVMEEAMEAESAEEAEKLADDAFGISDEDSDAIDALNEYVDSTC